MDKIYFKIYRNDQLIDSVQVNEKHFISGHYNQEELIEKVLERLSYLFKKEKGNKNG